MRPRLRQWRHRPSPYGVAGQPPGCCREQAGRLVAIHHLSRLRGRSFAFHAERVERIADHEVDLFACAVVAEPGDEALIIQPGHPPVLVVDGDRPGELVRPSRSPSFELEPERLARAFVFDEQDPQRPRDLEAQPVAGGSQVKGELDGEGRLALSSFRNEQGKAERWQDVVVASADQRRRCVALWLR